MPITVPAVTTGYVPIATSSWYIFTVPITLATLVPTRAELGLATTFDVTGAIAATSGFTTARDTVNVPIYGSTGFPRSLSGAKTVANSSLEFWADRLGADIRAILIEGVAVDVAYLPVGDVPAAKGEMWRCRVNSRSQPKEAAAAARVLVGLDVQAANEYFTIPV